MHMQTEKKPPSRHSIHVSQRELATITGITDVMSFDEESVAAETELGTLVIRGAGLHVKKVNLDSGELIVAGEVDSVTYEETRRGGKGLFGKIFR
jgi:sporulation protein YabP